MGPVFHRIISGFLTAVFIFSAMITGTYSWYSLQTTVNEASQTIASVRLQKREKLPDGTVTDHPVPGATFYLFTAHGEQIGGQYVTDEAGEIPLRLPAGSYYFEEVLPAPGYDFDSQNEEPVIYYPFILFEGDSDEVVVTAYNVQLPGSLVIQKTVQNVDGTPLTSEQLAQDFTFTVEFSDGGTYIYRKDDGEAGEVESCGTLTLRHGETALFENIPVGVTYTVNEEESDNYLVSATGHRGTIGQELSIAAFLNVYFESPELLTDPVRLTVKKELAGEFPVSDMDREFEMTVFINGKPTDFTLKPGESREFTLKPGDWYEVWEKDYYSEGYGQMITNGFGAAMIEDVLSTVTNTFTGVVMTEISGEKTWQGVEDETLLPESITLLLKDGERVVEEANVTPDEDGKWRYCFTVPKYNEEGNEIAYAVEELPLESFRPTYEGYDVINTYISPTVVVFPTIYKAVEGNNPPDEHFTFCITAKDQAPMPTGAKNGFLTLSLTGNGELFAGEIQYTKAGIYTYTVTEIAENKSGWIYDTSIYIVTITVTEQDAGLTAAISVSKDGEPLENIEFVNYYDRTLPPSDKTVIEGQKIWNHGSNPADKQPDSIIVLVYADGKLVWQQLVTAANGWRYRFELPKYNAAGKEIVYTIDEVAVDGYDKTVDEYDLINTYRENTSENPDITPPTGDTIGIWLWMVLMFLSGTALLSLLAYKKYVGRRCKHEKK